jgi:signal transduction histidine kinase/FixJ family two-component response regulator/CHASE3 domain sensor protein
MKIKASHNLYIKAKLILGYMLVILAVILTGYVTYTSFLKLLGSVDDLTRPNRKLACLNQILKDVTIAENNLRLYTLTQNESSLETYLLDMATLGIQIDSLKILTSQDSSQYTSVLQIEKLIQDKRDTLLSLQEVRLKLNNQDLSAEAIRKIAQLEKRVAAASKTVLSSTTVISTRQEMVPDTMHAIEAAPAEDRDGGFFKRLKKKQPRQEPVREPAEPQITYRTDTTIVIDTLQSARPGVVLGNVRRILTDLSNKEVQQQKLLVEKETELIESSFLIKNQLISLLNEMEQQEMLITDHKKSEAKLVAGNSTMILLVILLASSGVALVFVIFIINDINKSNYYKQQLIESQAKAEKLAQVKQNFLSNMSHEIRTPLGAIVGFSERLAKEPLNAQQQTYVDAVRNSSDFLLSTVNEILDLSKIEAGKLSIEVEPFSFRNTLESVCQTLSIKAADKGISLDCQIPDQLPDQLLGDAYRLKQILINLVNNAIKFTEEGSVKIEARVKEEFKNKACLEISVSDTGIGIPPEKQSLIFEDFSQADNSTARKYGGTGLGLSICKRILELQGGSIRVKSQPGKGSVFTFALTYDKTELAPARHIQQEIDLSRIAPIKMLFADDDAYNLVLYRSIVNAWGVQADLVKDGQEAIEKAITRKYDIIFLDINMPILSGMEVADYIRNKPNLNAQVPIVALTANVIRDDINSYIEAGMTACLSKPFKEEDLYSKIIELVPEKEIEEESIFEEENIAPVQLSTAAQLYSLDNIATFARGDDDTLRMIIESFISETKNNLAIMQEAADNKNWATVGGMAHKMVNGFCHFEVNSVVPALRKLENMSKTDGNCLEAPEYVQFIVEHSYAMLKELSNEPLLSGTEPATS